MSKSNIFIVALRVMGQHNISSTDTSLLLRVIGRKIVVLIRVTAPPAKILEFKWVRGRNGATLRPKTVIINHYKQLKL